jgi:hypothetical protein
MTQTTRFPSFRQYLSGFIETFRPECQLLSISRFQSVPMPRSYPPDRFDPGFHDLLQWRKESIGNYVAIGAAAAKANDPNHLLTYSMIGGIFGEADAHYTCEDARTIVARCAAADAPLNFWSINNYAITASGAGSVRLLMASGNIKPSPDYLSWSPRPAFPAQIQTAVPSRVAGKRRLWRV